MTAIPHPRIPDDWTVVSAWVQEAWLRLALKKPPKVDRGFGFICYCSLCCQVRKASQ